MQSSSGPLEKISAGGVFHVKCYDTKGNVRWEVEQPNLVVNEGLAEMNTWYFKGISYTAALKFGMINGPASGTSFAATDTMASHPGWTEFTNYSGTGRSAVTVYVAATAANPSVIQLTMPARIVITGNGTVGGVFITTGTIKGGTAGQLFSACDFNLAPWNIDRSVYTGDELSVVYQFSLSAT